MNKIIWCVILLFRWVSAEQKLESTPCVDWESNAAAYQTAFGNWNDPACYQFSFTFLGYTVGGPIDITRKVGNGETIGVGDSGSAFDKLQTIEDFYNLINQECLVNCPESGAHQCSMTYTTADSGITYPSFISIDKDEYIADEELIYRIENFEVTECGGSGGNGTSIAPSDSPSTVPSGAPSMKPTDVMNATEVPTSAPEVNEVNETAVPTSNQTVAPTITPQANETAEPTASPVVAETDAPTITPQLNETGGNLTDAPSVAIRAFSMELLVDDTENSAFNKAALIETMEQYLYNDMIKSFSNLLAVELTEVMARVRKLQQTVDLELEGTAIFSGTSPDTETVAAQQAMSLEDTARIQEAVSSNPAIGANMTVASVKVVDVPTAEPTSVPTQAENVSSGTISGFRILSSFLGITAGTAVIWLL